MNEICHRGNCTGCGLCVAQCPQQSISMREGVLGHLYPYIDQSSCVNCGLCVKCCPANTPSGFSYPLAAFAGWSKDNDDYKSSASGGVASVLSRHIIRQGGIVYGCAMLPDIDVRHIRIENSEDIVKLKGSKYVQSTIVDVIPSVKADIQDGKKVLFIGTPCQIAAIKKMFKKQPENLYLVDVICHGVPSLKSLQEHISHIARYSKYDDIFFREGNHFVLVVKVGGKDVYRRYLWEQRYRDTYFNCFIDGYTYRQSCYTCRYACPERISDITIGDFWGLGRLKSTDEIPEHSEGCSVILPITEKGMELTMSVSNLLHMYEREIQEAVAGNDQLRSAKMMNQRIKWYRRMMRIVNFPPLYYLFESDRILFLALQKIKNHFLR